MKPGHSYLRGVLTAFLAACVVLPISYTALVGYRVQTDMRFATTLRAGTNEIWLALGKGKYYFRVLQEPSVGMTTLLPADTNAAALCSVHQGERALLLESKRRSGSFHVVSRASGVIRFEAIVDCDAPIPLYLSLRRSK